MKKVQMIGTYDCGSFAYSTIHLETSEYFEFIQKAAAEYMTLLRVAGEHFQGMVYVMDDSFFDEEPIPMPFEIFNSDEAPIPDDFPHAKILKKAFSKAEYLDLELSGESLELLETTGLTLEELAISLENLAKSFEVPALPQLFDDSAFKLCCLATALREKIK